MARPRPQLPAATAIRALADDKGLIEVRVTPNASADEIALPAGDGSRTLSIRTTAAPEDGKANRAVLRLLSRALGLPACPSIWCAAPPAGTSLSGSPGDPDRQGPQGRRSQAASPPARTPVDQRFRGLSLRVTPLTKGCLNQRRGERRTMVVR